MANQQEYNNEEYTGEPDLVESEQPSYSEVSDYENDRAGDT